MPVSTNPKRTGVNLAEWVVVEDIELSANASSVTFSGLNGDNSKSFRLLCVYETAGTLHVPSLTLNADTGANYDYFTMSLGASYTGATTTGDTDIQSGQALGSGVQNKLDIFVQGISGLTNGHMAEIKATSNNSPAGQMVLTAGEWNSNAAITSIEITDTGISGLFSAGGRFILMELI